ncbi:MAG: hypothetical protein ABJA11_11610, partial [Pseudolysinimonas sp.]
MDEPTVSAAAEQPVVIDGLEPGMTIVRRVRGPRRWPGVLSGVLALLMLAATAIGIQLAAHNQLIFSSYAAYASIGLSVAALVFGLIAIIRRWGRGAGIAGAIV